MSYEGSSRKLSSRPVADEEVRDFINRELMPLITQWRSAYNGLISEINSGLFSVGNQVLGVSGGAGAPTAAPDTGFTYYIQLDAVLASGKNGPALWAWDGAAWALAVPRVLVGDASVISGTGAPVAAPETSRAIYIQTDGGGATTLWVWEGAAWVGK